MAVADGTLLVATRTEPKNQATIETLKRKGFNVVESATPERWTAQPLALKDFPEGRIKAFIWALGEDEEGELYVLTNGANLVTGSRGKVFKLVPQ